MVFDLEGNDLCLCKDINMSIYQAKTHDIRTTKIVEVYNVIYY